MKASRPIVLVLLVAALGCVAAMDLSTGGAAARVANPPGIVRSVAPSFASVSLSSEAEGQVLVQLEVNGAGDVVSSHASEGHPQLRAASEEAAKKWKFAPANELSRTVKLLFDYPHEFYFGYGVMTVYPYHLQLTVERPPSIDFVPADWKAGTTECERHRVPLQRGELEIGYGMVWPRPDYYQSLEAQKKDFPNTRSHIEAGCVYATDKAGRFIPRYAEILYCPKCRKAEEQWYQEHPIKPLP